MLTRSMPPQAPLSTPVHLGGAAPPPPGVPQSDVLDAGALAKLAELDPTGASQLLPRVLRAFETSAQRLVPQLEQSRRDGDHTGVHRVAHTFKSSAASIGALKLSALCADIEAELRQGQSPALDARIDAMCAELAIVLQAIAALYPRK